nr:MAG TPA: hypothetical protein [Caudoviricetes sp.]
MSFKYGMCSLFRKTSFDVLAASLFRCLRAASYFGLYASITAMRLSGRNALTNFLS